LIALVRSYQGSQLQAQLYPPLFDRHRLMMEIQSSAIVRASRLIAWRVLVPTEVTSLRLVA
jgi:hypothetical protein